MRTESDLRVFLRWCTGRALIRWRLLEWTSSGACADCGRPVGVVADLVAAVGKPQIGGV
jgi:hypothetical protein